MFPMSPSLFTAPLWPLEAPVSHDQSFHYYLDPQASESFPFDPPSQPQGLEFPPLAGGGRGNPTMVKKLNHNASERDRRQKINGLYSSLRSLLPLADQLKTLSNPATISRVIKYIPELQQQVEGLKREKEELLSKLDGQGDDKENKSSAVTGSTSFVTANQINEREIMIQISACNKIQQNLFFEILTILEEDGLLPLNASSFGSSDGRVFCNLHLQITQVENGHKLEAESLSRKLLTALQRKEI